MTAAIYLNQKQGTPSEALAALKTKKKTPPYAIANIHFCGLIARELADTLEELAEIGIVSRTDLKYLSDVIVSDDMDTMYNVAKQVGRKEEWLSDFETIVAYFDSLADRNLSQVQKHLKTALKTILIIDYSLTARMVISATKSQVPQQNITRILNDKRNEVLRYFEAEYSKVSNYKFEFGKFDWMKLAKSDYENFLKIIG